jgi:type I restriction enzyme, S subunit
VNTTAQQKMSWQNATLGCHIDLLAGFAFKSQLFTDNEQDIPLVKGENLHQGYIDWDKAKRWNGNELSQYQRFQLNEGDVVLAMDRPWIEAGLKYAWIKKNDPKALLVQRVARLRGCEGLSTDYLRYIIGSPQFTDYIKPIVTGVNVPHISGQQIKDFRFLLPPLPIQHRIADILSTYDELIENNTRRIRLLEEMARRIYEEWFVRFRFPRHENVNMVESELGLIPEGWEVAKLQDLYGTASGGTPSRKNAAFFGGEINWVKSQELSDGFIFETIEKITEHGLNNSSAKIFPPQTILIAMYGATIGALGILASACATNQACCAIMPNHGPFSFSYIFLTLLVRRLELIELRAGAAQQNINQILIRNFRLLKPDLDVMKGFNEITEPIINQIRVLQKKCDVLRGTRDLLLPKLISGELDVSNFPEPEAL